MDHTNISRYQNPPEQAEYSVLSHLNSKQDFLDVFVIGVLHRSPIIYVLINITLLIWLSQTIISSKIQQIPKSAFLISPYLGQQPIKDIFVTKQDACPNKWQKVRLRTFPTIFQNSFTRKQMYQWNIDGNMSFCIQRINLTLSQFQPNNTCNQNKTLCNGYCFDSQKQCPITAISIMKAEFTISNNNNRKIFYTSSDGSRYLYSKKQGKPIINLIATFHHRCSNDFHYNDEFTNLTQYQKSVMNCGQQGTINAFYDKLAQMKTQTFMIYNNRPFKPINDHLQDIELGSVHQIDFNQDMYGQCSKVRDKARKASDYLFNDPVQPLFTQSLLVIGFIIFIAQIIWLTLYICVNGYFNEKNIIAILICVIQLTVITFIYSQNSKVFDTQQFIRSIANCIESEVLAASSWNFGLKSSTAFTMIQYVGTIFLALYLFAYLMDKLMFQPSSQLYKNFVYDENNQRFSGLSDRAIDRNEQKVKNENFHLSLIFLLIQVRDFSVKEITEFYFNYEDLFYKDNLLSTIRVDNQKQNIMAQTAFQYIEQLTQSYLKNLAQNIAKEGNVNKKLQKRIKFFDKSFFKKMFFKTNKKNESQITKNHFAYC